MKDKELEELAVGRRNLPDGLQVRTFYVDELEEYIAQERRKAYDQGYADGYLSWENKKNEEARVDAINLNKAIKNLAELKEDKE